MKFRLNIAQSSNSPMAMHRGNGADPQDHWAIEVKKLTSIRTKTDDIREQIDRLSWISGLYMDNDDNIVYPTFNVWRSIQEGAKRSRSGRKIEAGLLFDGATVPVNYDGPKDYESLYKDPSYVWRAMVTVDRKRIPRVRPVFNEWSMTLTGEIDESVMSPEEFVHFVNEAGSKVGIGDARKLGYGRFAATIEWL